LKRGTLGNKATSRGQVVIVGMKGTQTIMGGCGTWRMQYSVYAVLGVCCTRYMLYSVYAVLGVCWTRYALHSVLTHDHGMER
jgi:hypothetical protein